jgi:hypothetical protein
MLVGTTGATTQLTLSNAGNLGLGVTPNTWTSVKAIEMGELGSAVAGGGNNILMFYNSYFNSGFKYARTGAASYYQQTAGTHVWTTAASGTAGNTISFTQAMTLDASGNLGVGNTSPAISGYARSLIVDAGSSNYSQMRLSANNGSDLTFFSTGTSAITGQVSVDSTSGANPFMTFRVNGAERARIDSSGNLLVNTTSSTASTGQTAKLQVSGGIRTTTGFTSSISLGTIAQNATTTASVGYNGFWLISNGGEAFALINIVLSGGGTKTQLIFSSGTDIVCGTTSEPSGGTYLRLWISGGVLQVKNVNAYTGPWFLTPIATFGT